jgi:hypothetical protein
LQWLKDLSEIYADNANKRRHEANRNFGNKKKEYLEDKIIELATNNKSKDIRVLYRGINEFKRGYQPRSNLVNRGGPGSISGLVKWDLWRWGRFSPSTSVSPANIHYIYHLGPVQ